MKEGEEGDSSHGESHGKLSIDRNRDAQCKDRGSDGNFNREKGDSKHAENSTHKHERDESKGNSPYRTASHLGAQNADAEHRKKVIKTEDRVGKACSKAEWAVTRMGKERKWK
jgi:hypothetical protein